MKTILKALIILFISVSYSQQDMDTIYGNPKYVREKVEFLKKNKQNYKFLDIDGDYGHAIIFTPKKIKNRFNRFWFHDYGCFYVNYEKEFFRNGLAKNETWYNKDGSIEEKYKYKYDKENNLIEKKDLYYYDEFRLMKYHYNKKNNIIAISTYFSDEPNEFMHSFYTRDINDSLIESSRYNHKGRGNSIIYNRDSLNRKLKVFRKEIFFRKNSQNKKKVNRDSFGLKKPMKEYEFDLLGNKIKEIRYNEDTKKVYSKFVFKYDNNSNLIYKGSFKDSLRAFTRNNYNDKNLLVKSEYVNIKSPGFNKVYNYEYNSENYINKLVYTEFGAYEVVKKKIHNKL